MALALSEGGDQAEVFVEDRVSLSLRLEDGRLEEAVSGNDRGGSLRLVRGLSTRFGYVDSVEAGPLSGLALELARAGEGSRPADARGRRRRARASAGCAGAEGASATALRQSGAVGEHVVSAAGWLRLADHTARGTSLEVQQVIAVYGESRQRVWIVNSDGTAASDDRRRTMLAVTVMAKRDTLIQVGRETLAFQGGLAGLDEQAVTALAADAAQKALVMLDSSPAPGGRMAVVLANGFGGVLFHEACGHGLEADYILKKSSVWEGKIGRRVAGEHVFAYDDGVGEGMWGSNRFDDEGTACGRTTLIEAGILTGYLTDRLRGAELGLPLTGNGRRQDFRHLPYPRMTNTYFGAGGCTAEEIIADTPRALYAKSLSGGQVNPATGEFVFGVAEGYLIEGGKIAGPVRGATLVGNGPEVLKGIDAIADDLEIKPGTCGKEGQAVAVGSGQPTVRIRELTVGGTGG